MCKRSLTTQDSNDKNSGQLNRIGIKIAKTDEVHDPENTPTNLPELGKLADESNERNTIELGESTIPPGYDSASYMGASHADDPYLNRYLEVDPEKKVIPFVTRATRIVQRDTAFTVYERDCSCDEAIRAVYESKWDRLEKLVDPYRDQLLALYFRFIDWTYPAVDKKRFYRSYFHNDPPLHRGLVSAMLGLGVTYWKYSTQLCVKPIPPDLTSSLWKMSLYYIEHDVNCKGASLDTVQALLLYIQKRLAGDGIHEQVVSRIHVGMLVSMAYSLGLHIDCTNWEIGDIEKFSRRRLWALVYYTDKWTSANLGHPSLLGGRPESQIPYTFESKWREERRFVQLVKITNILSKVLEKLYDRPEMLPLSPRSPHINSKQALHTHCNNTRLIAESLLSDLRDWKASLPEDLSDMKARNSLNYCSNGMIHLSALAVEVLIFRVLILPCFSGKYRHEARDLVQRIIIFCLEISHSHLHAFWIASCRLSLSSLTHFVLRYHAQSPEVERKKNTPLMRSWLECLRSLSHGWEEGIGLAYHRMDALFYKGQTSLHLPIIDEEFINDGIAITEQTLHGVPAGREYHTRYVEDLREEPLGLEEDFIPHDMEPGPPELLFNDETLRDILQDLMWE